MRLQATSSSPSGAEAPNLYCMQQLSRLSPHLLHDDRFLRALQTGNAKEPKQDTTIHAYFALK